MPTLESNLLLLITNLSQLKNKKQVIRLFIEGASDLFQKYQLKWHFEADIQQQGTFRVCTREKTFGFIETDQAFENDAKVFPHFQNAIQLLAIILENLEQYELLHNQKAHLQQLVDQQTLELIRSYDEINETNEELATTNEELIESNQSLIEINQNLYEEIEKREVLEKKLLESDKFFKHSTDLFCIAGFDGYFKVLNPTWETVLGWSIDEMLAKPWNDFLHPDDITATENIKSTIVNGREVYHFENRYRCKNGAYKWLSWNSYPHREENIMFGVARDVTSLKEAENRLKQIEWMLNANPRDINEEALQPGYGDLTAYNQNGLIANSINKEELYDIAYDYLGLLETSSAIYEKNGDYALGIFSSGWCRFMDSASRKLCNTKSNRKALKSGKWLCHESCWTDASKKAIETGKTVDIQCNGGLNLYVEPIKAAEKVVGAINFGYGDPPTNDHVLKELAEKYQVSFNELKTLSKTYESRPPFVVELARKRLKYSARQIGTLIERKQAKDKLKQSEEKYRTLIDFAPDAFFQGDLNGNFIEVNIKASELTGYSKEELLSMNMSQLFSPTELYENPLRYDLLQNGKTVISERRLIKKNGKTLLAEMNSRQLPDGSMQSFVRDISERIKTEEQLRTLTVAINQSPNSIVITNKKGIIEYVNPVIEKLSGYKKEELLGQNPRIFSSGKTSKEEYRVLWETIGSGKVWKGEFQNKKKNGSLFWESATISPVFNGKGKITHYLAIREDITAQKKMTQELIAAKEKAEESDRLKTSFLANMSHEIRTPMNSIMGFASLLPEEESKELMCQYANIIVRNSEQLVHIIDDIVLYSRLQTRLLQNIPSEFDVAALFNDIKQSFYLPEFIQKGINLLSQNNNGQLCIVKTDYDKLRQIFTNLVSNAFKYTNAGSITIGTEYYDKQLCFFVKDTGIGIPESEIKKVFERFYRGSNASRSNIGGTGLGLSIVKELVELLGGKIWVESEEGKGSTFYFTLSDKNEIDCEDERQYKST